MTIPIDALNLDSIPPRPAGSDRITTVIVMDRTDPVGTDPESADPGWVEFLTAAATALGVDPADVHTRTVIEDTETVTHATSTTGLPTD